MTAIPSPFDPTARAAATGHPTALPPADGDRVITGAQMRSARTWAAEHRGYLQAWTCEERVVATVASLIADPQGHYDPQDLRAALHEVDTVDVALDLLTAIGAGCHD